MVSGRDGDYRDVQLVVRGDMESTEMYSCAVGAPRTSDYRPAQYDTFHPSPPFFLPDLPEA